MTLIFILLIIFQLKHFICDFPLQNTYMLGKMKETGWILPLAAHAGVHSLTTLLVTFIFTTNVALAITLFILDFIIHFSVDRIKASPALGGRFNPTQSYFWWALGADQMAHHLTHYVFIYLIISFIG